MWSETIRPAAEALVSLFYPPHCVMCAAPTSRGRHVCEDCAKRVRRIERPFCDVCSEPFFGAIDGAFHCANCAGRDFHFSHAISRFRSSGVVRELVHRFKYERAYYLRHQLGDWLAETMDDSRITGQPVDWLIPVPLHPARQREREFNQADVLSELLARRTGLLVRGSLQRIRYTTTQTRFDRLERMENLRNAFALHKNDDVRGKHLVLVDDVLTTGSTLDECARVLRQAGAASVRAVTVARG